MTPPASAGLDSQRTTLSQFDAAVGTISTEPTLREDVRAQMQERVTELAGHLRNDVRSRSFVLRAILRINVAHHALRAAAPTDARVQSLRAAQSELQSTLSSVDTRSGMLGAVGGYADAGRDVWNEGAVKLWRGHDVNTERVGMSAALLLGGAALATASVNSLESPQGPDRTPASPTLLQRLRSIFGRLFMPLLLAGGFLGLGAFSRARAATLQPGEASEPRNYVLNQDSGETVIRGMRFQRATAGGEVVVNYGGGSYQLLFENLPGIPQPSGAEPSLGQMLPRLYQSGSTGLGVGVEQPGATSVNASRFVITEGAIANVRAALDGVEADAPAGTLVDMPMRFNLQTLKASQLDFIKRCIERGYTVNTTDDTIVVTAKIRVRRAGSATIAPETLVRPAFTGNLGRLGVGSHDFQHPAATSIVTNTVPYRQLATATGSVLVLGPKVRIQRLNANRIRVVIDPTPGDETHIVQIGGETGVPTVRFTTSDTEAPIGEITATTNRLRDVAVRNRARAIANAQAAAATNGLTTHSGSPEGHASISADFNAINALVPAAQRGSPLITTALSELLALPPGSPLSGRVFQTATGSYRLRAQGGQLAFELQAATTPTSETVTLASREVVRNRWYRVRLPAGATQIAMSTRDVTASSFTPNASDARINLTFGIWDTCNDPPARLRVVGTAPDQYVEFRAETNSALKLWCNTTPRTTGGPYTVTLPTT